MILLLDIMTVSLGLFVSPANAIALAAAAVAIIFLASNFTITTNAQQQLPTATTQSPSVTHGPMLLNKKDSFRVQLPEGWVIQDINNTGFTLAAEVVQGYGVLAELCPQGHEQGQAVLRNVGRSSSSNDSNTYIGSCQQAGEEVIHILRYPNLGAKLGITSDDEDIFTIINRDTIPNAILDYHIQKLKEVGYRDIQIVNSIDTTINVDNSTGLNGHRRIPTTVPAKFVEMTYNTNFAPNETRTGYFILTATAATPRNLGMVTGYSIFYEGNSAAQTTISSGSLSPSTPLPAAIRQVFDSFELVAAPTEPLRVETISSDTEGVAPATFEFEADVTGGMEPYTINWDFDDGSVESDDDETVDHTFDQAGTYNVDLTVTDSTGRTASDSILITVEAPPSPPPSPPPLTTEEPV